MNVAGSDTGGEELGAVGFAQVQQDVAGWRLMAWGLHVQPLQGIWLVTSAQLVEPFRCTRKLRLELDGHFGADFIATAADRRTKCCENVRGAAAELHGHFSDSLHDNAPQCAAPSGVDGGHSTSPRIDQENWNTIRSLNSKEQARAVCYGGIAMARIARMNFEIMHDVGMNLFQCREGELIAA